MLRSGIKVTEVERNSVAEQAGIAAGDEICAVNGRRVQDELALRYHLAEESVRVDVRKADGTEEVLDLELTDGVQLGIHVEDFETRTCNNACLFCFIDQLPPGVRKTLRVKDDDYRLSFLHGNYITLTNLPERELDRIIEQRLSPLYISVHATDPALRTRILGRRKPDDLQRKIEKLISGGIRLNAQVVLMPGINDGENLERTVFELYAYYPGVHSIAIVPLGLSSHGPAREHYTPVSSHFCQEVIRHSTGWQERFRREIGRTFAYLADEFYILGGVPLPEAGYYDDFAQIEDGVGMVRHFLDDFEDAIRRRRPAPRAGLRGTLATAKLFRPYLNNCIERFNARYATKLAIVEVTNHFLGRDITVAGLLSGRDIVAALINQDPGDFVIIPGDAISQSEGILVDDMSPSEITRRLGKPVYPGGRTAEELLALLCSQM